MILTKHKKYFSDSFPSTNRMDLYEVSREFHETNRKFDKNTEMIKTYCLPFRKENQAFHEDMKKVHYVPANQYNTETNVLFKKNRKTVQGKGIQNSFFVIRKGHCVQRFAYNSEKKEH